jgi:signal transduction histidine kinase
MSHELRTPMNAIIGYSELLTEEAEDAGAEHLVEDLARIRQAGTHLLDLINGVLDLSKIEADKMDVFIETVDVVQLVDGIASTVAPLVHATTTVSSSTSRGHGTLETDATKLRQTLLNLLSNAAKFTEHGTIIGASAGDGDVVVRGRGHRDRDRARGRRPALRAVLAGRSVDDAQVRGTGLGLAISRRFCEMLGGGHHARQQARRRLDVHGATAASRAGRGLIAGQLPRRRHGPGRGAARRGQRDEP